nr:MAG TPA: ATP dependent DNA helicase [Caudoviricetes sp.]
MGCVNKSSKEFKDLAARNNLADNTLELITHKYWLETGNETLFPTDVYIQAQLGNTQYQESGKSVRELWRKMYNTPQEFKSLSQLQVARKEASRFFPQSAIIHYRNTIGNYVLSVKRPVEKADYSKDDFFNELDNIGSMRDVKKLNLGIAANQTYTISKVQELYNRFNDDRTSKTLADKVFSIAKDLGIEVSFNETLPFGIVGRYTDSNSLIFKKSFFENNTLTNKKAPIILHELLHALSMYALSNKTENWKRPEALQEFRTEINSLYQDLKNNPLLKDERGVVDVFEFVAELANPVFRSKIQEIDKQNKSNKSFWSRILDAFKSLLGLHTSDTYYQRSMNALDKALNAFDIDTYMRYNGIKSQLRKEVANNTINQTNQRLENKKLVKYDKAIKSAGRLFLQIYRSLQEGEQKYRRENEGKTNEGKSLRERGYEEAARQQRQLLDWAEKNHQLIYEPNDYYDDIFNDQSLHGTESKVWIDQKKGVVIKNVSSNHYQNIKALLNRIAIHNIAFPSTAMTLKKIGTSDKGISLIIEQPLIKDSDNIPTLQEIQNYMTNTLGFTLSKGKGINAEYIKDGYLVTDIRPENVIKQPDGSLAVIDCFAKFEDESMGNNIMGDVENQAQRFIDSMSSSQLKDETDLIKQESADYDLVNDIEPKQEHSGKPVPQDFTFADGTKVKAPFKPNAQQIDALNEMDRFMKSDEISMTLSGYAGTGKTSLMEMIAQKGRKQHRPVVFCATTNKATAVLNERVSKAGFKAATLNKVFGIGVEVDSNSRTYNARNLVNVIKDAFIPSGTTVIIDEASMINEENYGILNNIAKHNSLKIIYVGDEAQLAPVGEDKISKVFRNGDGEVIRLTQVERTDDNAILKEATDLRNGNPLSGISSFNDKGEGVAYISPNHQDEINNVVANYVKGLKHDPNYFRILAFTNKAVSAYNNQVRELLGYTSPIPQVGEPMTGYNNWGYEWKTKSYRFINSESYKVAKVDKSHKITTNLNDGTAVIMEVIPLTLEDSLGNIDTFNFIDIKSNPSNLQAAIQLANEKKMLWAEAKHAIGMDAKIKIYQRIAFIDNFLFVNDNIEDSNHNLLQAKTIDFGYAMTVHKSQGSTFTNVLMDDVDISRAGLNSNNAMEVVDLGEVDNNVASSANFTGDAEDVDLGFSNDFSTSSTEPTKHIAPTQTINLKQQLEYVGVSRATDTVTIVSNNVKKEGSPLHSTKEVKEDKVNSNTTHLNITPANSVDKKAAIKGAMANKFIGFAEGIFNSSTGKYAQQAGDKANTGNYTSDDVVFVSIPGKRGNEDVRHQQQDRTIAEALKALKAGATLLTDNKAYTENSTYNEGEKRLAKALNDTGAIYSEIQKDNQTIGVWTINTNNSRSNNKIENNESNNTRNAETVAGKQQTSNGGLLAESQARIQRGDGNLRETQKQGVLSQEDIDKRNQEDRDSLEKFAKEQGKWADNVDTKLEKKYGSRIGHGSEAWVYRKDKDTVIKSRSITGYNTVSDALRSIELHNILFPETAMKVVGFGNGDGEFSIIIEQPFIEGAYASQEEIDSFVKERFNAEKDPSVIGNTSYKTDDYLLQDLKPQNVLIRIVNGERQYNIIDGDFYDNSSTKGTKPLPQANQLSEEVKSPTSDTKINIYAGTNENADLSNFADRPFVIDKQLLNELGIDESSNIFINRDFNTVEGAFQGMKLAFINDPNDINDADNKLYKLQYATGSMARNIGRNIKNLDTQAWNANSSKIMKALIKASFSQNPDAAQRLIDTGDATLTHTQDESKWSTEFPRILMEVREELKKEKGIESTEQLQPSSTPILPEGSIQQVSLPSYEYFNDLYEDTPVDAAWKIPYLKELDAQISDENSIEDNQNIINRMDNILQSTSEKEYLQESKNSEKKQVEKTLDEYDKLNRQIDNLLGNQDLESDGEIYHLDELGVAHLSASEIRHTAELVANEISDSITKLQKEEGLAEKLFPTLKTDLDFKSASRKQIVEAVGINRLIDSVKSIFDTEANWDSYKDDENGISFQADLIFDNWDAIMYLAADVFAMNEGFGIAKDFSKGNFTTTDDSHIDYDNFNDYSNDQDIAAEEGEKDDQEHWQIENRTIDVLNSMSALVRQGIHECYLLNADSSKVMSKWGIAERVNPREAVNSILRWTQGSLSLNDMIKKLSNKQSQNPWLSQLVQRLSDKSGSETDFQSQFYGVFSKHFQPYSVVLLEDGKYHSIAVNSHPALTDVMNTITSQFKIGEHPLFGINGKVNTKLLGSTNFVSNDFTLHKALSELQNIDKSIKQGNTLDDKMSKVASDNIMAVCRAFGYNITEDMLSGVVNAESINKVTSALNFIVKDLDSAASAQHKGEMKDYNPFAFGTKFGINGSLRNFLTPITDKLEDTAVNAFYDSGKMYQSYVTPSFMTKLFNKFRQEGQAFEDFILNEYGSSEWFKFGAGDGDITKGWRNEWLRLLARDENARKVFDHKVELNFNKHNYMRNMSDAEYTLSLITEYFSESAKVEDRVPAWYRVPMQSNKPSSEFIKFYSYRGDGYKNAIVNGFHNMFLQEISRIQTVLRRNMSKNDPGFIKNFDTNGRKFCFLPVLNSYLENGDVSKRNVLHDEDGSVSSDNNRFASLLQKIVKGEIALDSNEGSELSILADKIIRQSMENRVQSILDTWESNGILEAAKNIKDIYPSEFDNSSNIKNEEREGVINDWVRKQVENFLWNDSFASKNILQLTLSDIAFYKDTEDLQKRLAQLHAPGVRGNINTIDYDGNRVSDGKYRTFILQDFDSFKSNIIANITEVFDRRIAAAPDNQKAALIALKESLVGKDGKYTKINVTDAQGYSSPSSYRKKAYIFGKWSRHAEDIYQKMLKGEYTYTDLETAFQPLKPFVYSKLTKDMGVANAPIHSMQVPFQAKNAEYLLIMADAILKDEKLSRPNLLRAVYRVMEDSERLMPTKGIDTVQFESSIKSGLQGKINIYQFMDMEGGEDAAYTFMMNQIFKEETDATGERVYKNYNTNTFVHETSFEDYCLQQEVPEHFKEHSQAHGSQIRMITPSDLDLFTIDENGQQVDNFYEWTEPDGTVKRMKADEFRKEYEQTIADNIEESIDNLSAELHLNSEDKRERNIALSKILQREILSSPRYGIDLVQACSIDKETGEFRIPKGDPIQAKRIEQLINSVIKNRVNKQKIAGGPIVQVSNFGTSKQLHIRFNDKQGNLIPLEEEYVPSEHDGLSYKDYLKKNQGGIAYFEVFCPIWSNELFDKFSNADGSINVDAINAVDPELLKMVSYRIPTEDKYSCAPMKVVGFMPREAGDAIMLPYELTEIDDSDFDVDKRYVMRKDIPIKTKRRKDIESELFKRASESYAKAHNGKTNNQWIGEQVRMFLDNPQKMKSTDKFMQWLYGQYQQVAYYTDAPTSGRMYRDNKIIDMTYAVLTNQMTADKILNPGGFDAPKKMGYMVAAYKNPANNGISWNALQGMSIDELKKLSYTDKDLTFADTQVQFYKQNSAAASLIGVFAVNKVAHATLESNDIFLDVSEICGNDDFTIAGTTFGGRMQIDQKYDREGTLIGKTLGSLVSASADAVKDPILNLMNVNMTTAGMLNTMLRLGMTFNDAALFLSQDVIERLLSQFNRDNLTNYVSLDSLINKWLDIYRQKYNISDSSNINTEPLSTEELVNGLTSEEHEATDYKVLLAFQKMRSLTGAMRKPTYATRFNSISSAVGPLIIDNLIIEHKMSQFIDANTDNGTHFYTADDVPVDIDDIFFDHPVLKQFARTVDIAKSLFSDMPAGSVGFRNLLAQLPKYIADKMYGDKKLLDQFSNFYQSYLLVQSGVIDSKNLKDYATVFPKWFMEQNFKDEFPNNELIQAIRMNVSKKTGHPYLTINITDMDEQRKEELRSAWIDLHKADPKLSKMLFDYSFFRAGIGFSPKTFMALVPTYVKERLMNENTGASYVDTYRHFPTVVPKLVINQFIRNNWDNTKLVPWKGGKDTHYNVNLKAGELRVYRPEEIADLTDVSYMKTKVGKEIYLWHLETSSPNELTFKRVKPLGNNGEYLEISTSEIVNPLSDTSSVSEDKVTATVQESATDLKTESHQESSAEESVKTPVITKTEEVKNLSAIADLIMLQNPKLDHEGAEKLALEIKDKEKMFRKFLQKVFKHKGLDLNEDEAIDEFHKYC